MKLQLHSKVVQVSTLYYQTQDTIECILPVCACAHCMTGVYMYEVSWMINKETESRHPYFVIYFDLSKNFIWFGCTSSVSLAATKASMLFSTTNFQSRHCCNTAFLFRLWILVTWIYRRKLRIKQEFSGENGWYW